MLYEAKQGTKAYEYIKGILEAEEKRVSSLHGESGRSCRLRV